MGKELVAEMALGNKEAFKRLYAAYAPALLGYISRFVADTRSAEQVLQSVFITIWHSSAAMGNEPLFTWLLRTTRSAINAFLNENGNGRRPGTYSFMNIYSTAATPETNDIEAAVLNEVYFNGSSIQEVATKLNIEKHALQLVLRDAVTNLKNMPQ